MDEYATVEDAQAALESAFKDHGEYERDEIAFDLICSIAGMARPEIAREFCRRELGYVPRMMDVVHPGLSREMEE